MRAAPGVLSLPAEGLAQAVEPTSSDKRTSVASRLLPSDVKQKRVAKQPARRSRPPKIAEVVANNIRKLILRGDLAEGDFLQPEAQLIKSLEVSRPTIREALRILETEQLITVVRGSRSGPRVHKPSIDNLARYAGIALQAERTALADVYQARLAIEPFVVRMLAEQRNLAAVRRAREKVEELYGLLDQERLPEFRVKTARLHLLLVELSGNRTLTLVLKMLESVLERHQSRYDPGKLAPTPELQRKAMRAGVRSFEKLLACIERGDAEAAEAHWRRHLLAANESWLVGFGETTILDVLE